MPKVAQKVPDARSREARSEAYFIMYAAMRSAADDKADGAF